MRTMQFTICSNQSPNLFSPRSHLTFQDDDVTTRQRGNRKVVPTMKGIMTKPAILLTRGHVHPSDGNPPMDGYINPYGLMAIHQYGYTVHLSSHPLARASLTTRCPTSWELLFSLQRCTFTHLSNVEAQCLFSTFSWFS